MAEHIRSDDLITGDRTVRLAVDPPPTSTSNRCSFRYRAAMVPSEAMSTLVL